MKKRKNVEHRKNRFASKTGLAPGTLKYVGASKDFDVYIDQFLFTEEFYEEKLKIDLKDILADKSDAPVRWINITGIHQTEIIEHVGKIFGIHPLVLEDILHAEQRPKLEDFDSYLYFVLKMIHTDPETKIVDSEQVSILLFENTVITFQEHPKDVFDPIRERIRKGKTKLRKSGADYLMYSILDAIVDNYFIALEIMGEDLEEVESNLISSHQRIELTDLHTYKRELIFMRKSIWPLREVINFLTKGDFNLIKPETSVYMRDVYDHCVHVIDTLETYRDLTSGLMDLYLSSMSNKMNQVMKTLTIIATIFIPLTFIVGVYGMNFDYMPELHYHNAYLITWIVMLTIALFMLWHFKRKRWF
jgi:magnesium transporter